MLPLKSGEETCGPDVIIKIKKISLKICVYTDSSGFVCQDTNESKTGFSTEKLKGQNTKS
jgi:hypothetical protein